MVSDALGWLCIWESQNLLAFACVAVMSLLRVDLLSRMTYEDGMSAL